MHKMMPRLKQTAFPAIRRGKLETLQINVGYKCNQACFHCHVNASPKRKEMMSRETMETVLEFVKVPTITTVDITGGAPELNPFFREMVTRLCGMGMRVIDRCNLTILEEPGFEDMPAFLADNGVVITASLPCYLEDNVNQQRGDGVYAASIRALKKLNALGYGRPGANLELNLVYNPVGPQLPPAQEGLQADYQRELASRHGIEFNQLFTLANMPIARFGSTLVSKGQFHDYMILLRGAHSDDNIMGVMCRNLISVDYRGYVYDCDFNQMLGIPLLAASSSNSQHPRTHLRDLINHDLEGNPIMVADHCYGCTAGQGSSCGGALQ
ncbi:MAG: arsenosugar biosynthesis radical SAM protein ArsS [Gammaproteobacteria bacterium]|nr:arsenosugar biosynthesis radical SAM protein ArsS [Gammaproteobacteria bacterium]MBA3731074.1 arsenosugar biosynthesis radical SAM protein ArsS [Gammaproteobacteria bacterium]